MGKRSEFERKEADKYYTRDFKAVIPLLPFLPAGTRFVEPTAGAGHLIEHLERAGHECVGAFDILPESPRIMQADVLFFGFKLPACDKIITNPPWDREPLHDMIRAFTEHAETWLLFDADWAHTLQASPHGHFCRKIVSVGRVSWEDNGVSGKDNCCWYLFSKHGEGCQFHFRL